MENAAEVSSIKLKVCKEAVEGDQVELAEKVTSKMEQLSFKEGSQERNEDDVIDEGAVAHGAFGILLEELWMKVIDKLEDSEDIQNVLLAYPELDKPFQSMKASWLFGLVVPHLFNKQLVFEVVRGHTAWTQSKELLKLRLVSKRWKNAVEKSLLNHTDHHPLLPRGNNADLQPSVVTIPETHFNYHRIRKICLGHTKFHQASDINNFLEQMKNHQGNPFPGKSVLLLIYSSSFLKTKFRPAVESMVTLLERFGQHVFHLEISYYSLSDEDYGELQLFRNILKCLTLVPNLRSLIIFFDEVFGIDDEANNFFRTPESQRLFPKLANLNRFEMRMETSENFESTWETRMLETYGTKDTLRKLGVTMNLFKAVKPWVSMLNRTTHLTELHLFLDRIEDRDFDKPPPFYQLDKIEGLLKALPNHQEIRKFTLYSLSAPYEFEVVDINELIRILAGFQFESVILQDLQVVEVRPVCELSMTPVIGITSLYLEYGWGRFMSFDFLRRLPNLKLLTVYLSFAMIDDGKAISLEDYQNWEREEAELEGTYWKILRRYFWKAINPSLEIPKSVSIWKEMRSLEMLNVVIKVHTRPLERDNVGVQFARECGNKAFFGTRPEEVVKWKILIGMEMITI